jgi:hypothetical protein
MEFELVILRKSAAQAEGYRLQFRVQDMYVRSAISVWFNECYFVFCVPS